MGDDVNTKDGAVAPTLSPNAKYMFFKRRRGQDRGLYWVSTEIIEDLRRKVMKSAHEVGE